MGNPIGVLFSNSSNLRFFLKTWLLFWVRGFKLFFNLIPWGLAKLGWPGLPHLKKKWSKFFDLTLKKVIPFLGEKTLPFFWSLLIMGLSPSSLGIFGGLSFFFKPPFLGNFWEKFCGFFAQRRRFAVLPL